MPPRRPATAEEIVAALRSGTVYAIGEDRVISDQNAAELLKSRLNTTRARADEWLLAAVLAPDSELLLVSALGGSVRTADGWVPLTDMGWTPEEAKALSFDFDGHLNLKISGRGQWVMLRSSLERFHDRVRDHVAEQARAEAIEMRERRERFDTLHGDALSTVETFLSDLPCPEGFEEEMLDFNPDSRSRHHGDPGGTLTLRLRGPQIRALAEKLARLNALRRSDSGV